MYVIVCLRGVSFSFLLLQSNCYTLDGVDEKYEFSRLKQSMEMVGFSVETKRRYINIYAYRPNFLSSFEYLVQDDARVKFPSVYVFVPNQSRMKVRREIFPNPEDVRILPSGLNPI